MMQDEMGLNWLDYGARFYDAVLGRWHSLDPLEQYESGYVYGGNNPILMNDPSGMWADAITKTVIDNRGEIIYHDDSKDKNIYVSPDGVQGKDGNTTGLEDVGDERPGEDYSPGRYVWFNDDKSSNITAPYYYPASGIIDKDYTLEELCIPIYGWLKYLKILKWGGKYVGKYIFTITAKEGNLILFSTKVGTKTIEFGGNVSKSKGVLVIKNFDIDGTLTNKVGIKGLKAIITDFGKQQGVSKVIIEGAKRTTGANPGRIPSQLIFNID
jgi:RHS repeat-associated protein